MCTLGRFKYLLHYMYLCTWEVNFFFGEISTIESEGLHQVKARGGQLLLEPFKYIVAISIC